MWGKELFYFVSLRNVFSDMPLGLWLSRFEGAGHVSRLSWRLSLRANRSGGPVDLRRRHAPLAAGSPPSGKNLAGYPGTVTAVLNYHCKGKAPAALWISYAELCSKVGPSTSPTDVWKTNGNRDSTKDSRPNPSGVRYRALNSGMPGPSRKTRYSSDRFPDRR